MNSKIFDNTGMNNAKGDTTLFHETVEGDTQGRFHFQNTLIEPQARAGKGADLGNKRKNMIGLLLCHSHFEFRLRLRLRLKLK